MKIKTLTSKNEEDMKDIVDHMWREIKDQNKDITKEDFLDIMALLVNNQQEITLKYLVMFQNIPKEFITLFIKNHINLNEDLLTYCVYNSYINIIGNQLEFIRKKFPEDFDGIYKNIKKVVEEWK